MRPVIWISEGPLHEVCKSIDLRGARPVFVHSVDELVREAREQPSFSLVDSDALDELSQHEPSTLPDPIIVISRDPLPVAVGWLQPNPWLAHVVSASMLDQRMRDAHLERVALTAGMRSPRLLDWMGDEVSGRRTRLTHSNKRADRLERMREFLDSKGVRARTNQQLCDIAEELLTNAFYDAPVAAGALTQPISRTRKVQLQEKYACDLAYGVDDEIAIVRVRDPFGSLTRDRLVEVLARCARSDMSVEVDESMGGAGLGMWRVFANASFVAISVVQHRHTEILVGITKRASGPRPFAMHLFFNAGAGPKSWKCIDQTEHDLESTLLELESP